MPDDKMLALLAGLVPRRERILGPLGERIGEVRDSADYDFCADYIAHSLVTACHEYVRWLPVIEAAKEVGRLIILMGGVGSFAGVSAGEAGTMCEAGDCGDALSALNTAVAAALKEVANAPHDAH